MNAVIYARYSSQGQNEQSIEGQIRICQEFAESKGFKIVKTYIDKAKSAWSDSDKRVDFNKMLTEASNGVFQHIIVYKFDRFARNRLDSMIHKAKLKKEYGIRVISATEPVSDDEGGEIYEMFLEWNDEKYSQRLSKRVKDGFDTSVANGNFTGGVVLYGYKLVKEPIPNKPNKFMARIEKDEQAAENIKFIFEEYARGVDKKQIAEMLNAKGLRYNGKPFNVRSFDNWLINTKYYGHFTFGTRSNDDVYPAIISKKTFDNVQKRLKHNRHFTRTNHTREKYLLTGKVFCGHCESLMTADGANKKNKIYRYYGCLNARKKKCDKKLENKENLEQFVVSAVLKFLHNEKYVNAIADSILKFYAERTDENAIKSLDTRIQHVETQMESTTNAFIEAVAMHNDILKKTCDTKIKELQILLDDLKKQRSELLFEKDNNITKSEILAFVRGLLEREENADFYSELVQAIVKAVYVYDDKTIVWFNFDFDKDIKLPVGDELKDIAKINEAVFPNRKGANLNSSTPNVFGRGGRN